MMDDIFNVDGGIFEWRDEKMIAKRESGSTQKEGIINALNKKN